MSRASDQRGESQHTVVMHMLARLIEDVRAAQGWNQSEVARRAGLSRSRVAQLINEPVKAVPNRDTIESLARALGVPPWVVMDAVLEAVGLPTRPTRIGIEEAVRADSDLSSEAKRAVLTFVDHMRGVPDAPDLSRVQGLRLAEPEAPAPVKKGQES